MAYHSVFFKKILIASGLTVALLSGCSTIDGFLNKKPKVAATETATETNTSTSDTSSSTSSTTTTATDTSTSTASTTTEPSATTDTTSTTSSSSSDDEGTFHTIVSGDSLWKISQKYKCSIADLVKWNNFKNEKHVLMPGQKLRVSAP